MDRRRNKKHSNWNNQKNNGQQDRNQNQNQNQGQNQDSKKKSFQFNHTLYQNEDLRREKQKAIEEIKAREVICPKCNQVITDISSAFPDRATGVPVHLNVPLRKLNRVKLLAIKKKLFI